MLQRDGKGSETHKKEGVTEDLKNENPGKVNNIMARVEEAILREITYV